MKKLICIIAASLSAISLLTVIGIKAKKHIRRKMYR